MTEVADTSKLHACKGLRATARDSLLARIGLACPHSDQDGTYLEYEDVRREDVGCRDLGLVV